MRTIDIHAHAVPSSLWRAVDAGREWFGFHHEPGDGSIVGGGKRTHFTWPKLRFTPEERLQDMDAQAVFFKEAEQPERNLDLTRIEFKILLLLMKQPGQVFSRTAVLKKVWGEATHVLEHTVDTHISSLRKKIQPSGHQIKSLPKQGYYLE